MFRSLIVLLATLLALPLLAQLKPKLAPSGTQIDPTTIAPVTPIRPSVPLISSPLTGGRVFTPISHLPKPVKGQPTLKGHISQVTGTPYLITGEFKATPGRSVQEQAVDYLSAAKNLLKLDKPAEEFAIGEIIDENEFTHIRLKQQWQGLPVYGGEAVLHKKDDSFYLFNGRFFPSPKLMDVAADITPEEAADLALEHVAQFTTVKNLSPQEQLLTAFGQMQSELVIYHPTENITEEVLAYHLTVMPNIAHRYSYFIDAKTGEIISHHSELCQLTGHLNLGEKCNHSHGEAPTPESQKTNNNPPPPGPETAFATDLQGQSRLINVYETGGSFFMIDASRNMFSAAQSGIPNDPVGVVWTIDGQNNSPENSNFQAAHVTSSNNSWNSQTSVSAHYNGGLAYEYFKNTFGRESINGQGGNIVSLINITETDGSGMDNAFWNGNAMFYGNGNQAFTSSLAKSLDVAGHEMSHGVVQSTANLEYFGESGALNESFADVFGAMIDRDDWKVGEDVVNTSIFPTGALRDMANPHNGGSSLSDNGWQPDHYSERFTGQADNGGVHINSGIPNKAFQLFATDIGKDKAELVYYRALTQYLVKSSQFIDCRIAVIQAADDLYGATEIAAAENAFSAVGIGSGSGTNTQTDVGSNPGDDFVLMTDDGYNSLYIFTPDGTEIANPLTNVGPLSRPSITDDGSAIVYIAEDNTMQAITIDWVANMAESNTIQSDPMWRQVAVSKDGSRLAALTTSNDNELWIFDYGLGVWEIFNLTNPTTGQGGPTTGDVQYADVLEWDYTGEWVMYDALNSISTTNGVDIDYWDISFAKVWNDAGNNFENPQEYFISKLFSQLPEDVSVGNPTFSKNSDYIIACDYIDGFNDEYFLIGSNLETGDVGTILENSGLSWPSYSPDDSQIVFDAEDNIGEFLGRIDLASDKISSTSDGAFLFDLRRWGIWFANGERNLTSNEEVINRFDLQAYPNPVSETLTVEFSSAHFGDAEMQFFDLMGRQVLSQKFTVSQGENQQQFTLSHLPQGQYFMKMFLPEGNVTMKIMK